MASVERELHDWLRQQIDDSTSSSVLLGVGDDAAVIQGQTCPAVVSTDTIAQGTHFLVAEHSLELIGRKSLAVNLSDIAAMGAKPRTILLHWLLPDDFTLEQAKSLFFGVQQLADQYNVHVVGGDTNCWSGGLVVGATVLGGVESANAAWRMSGASSGDAIFVSGRFGGSILGHHLTFDPAVELAAALGKLNVVAAATDASDSLASDLNAMAIASGCGAEITLDRIPIADGAFQLARESVHDSSDALAVKQQAIDHALFDGEDFGLILAIPESKISILDANDSVARQLTRIGTFVSQQGLWTRKADGALEAIEPKGYDH